MDKPLYQEDIALWSAEQARAIRDAAAARINTPAPIDWENVAEEIESLGISQRTELRSRIAVILEHLMKLQASPAVPPRNSWMDTVDARRRETEYLLEDSPSLRREVSGLIAGEIPRARCAVQRALGRDGEQPIVNLDRLGYTEAQILSDWFPDAPTQQHEP